MLANPHWESSCLKRADGQHCDCWYDGDRCCACDASEMSHVEKVENGMEEKTNDKTI